MVLVDSYEIPLGEFVYPEVCTLYQAFTLLEKVPRNATLQIFDDGVREALIQKGFGKDERSRRKPKERTVIWSEEIYVVVEKDNISAEQTPVRVISLADPKYREDWLEKHIANWPN